MAKMDHTLVNELGKRWKGRKNNRGGKGNRRAQVSTRDQTHPCLTFSRVDDAQIVSAVHGASYK